MSEPNLKSASKPNKYDIRIDDLFMAPPESVDPEECITAKYYVESPMGLKAAGIAIATEE